MDMINNKKMKDICIIMDIKKKIQVHPKRKGIMETVKSIHDRPMDPSMSKKSDPQDPRKTDPEKTPKYLIAKSRNFRGLLGFGPMNKF